MAEFGKGKGGTDQRSEVRGQEETGNGNRELGRDPLNTRKDAKRGGEGREETGNGNRELGRGPLNTRKNAKGGNTGSGFTAEARRTREDVISGWNAEREEGGGFSWGGRIFSAAQKRPRMYTRNTQKETAIKSWTWFG